MGEKRIKIYKSHIVKSVKGTVGEIVDADKFIVCCGDNNGIAVDEIQAEGGKRMKTADYLRGNKIEKGTKLS